MSNIIPPLLSNSPPPMVGPLDDDEDDEFGDFRAAVDLSCGCDTSSSPSTPEHYPQKIPSLTALNVNLDINSNSDTKCNEKRKDEEHMEVDKKDHQDRRKDDDGSDLAISSIEEPPVLIDKVTPSDLQNFEANFETDYRRCNGESYSEEFGEFAIHVVEESLAEVPVPKSDCTNLETREVDALNGLGGDDVVEENEVAQELNREIVKNQELDVEIAENNSRFVAENCDCKFNTHIRDETLELNGEYSSLDTKIIFNDDDTELSEETEEIKETNSCVRDASLSECFSESVNLEDDKNVEDDFGDFENHFVDENPSWEGNFDTQETKPSDEPKYAVANEQSADDFGEFESHSFASASTSNFDEEPTISDPKEVFEIVSEHIKAMFPNQSPSNEDYDCTSNFENDAVFNAIKDITETKALTYQWNKSSSQKILLKALNIDVRNILYGHGWNPLVPTFAANLSLAPLEPVKSNSPGVTSPATEEIPQPEVPTAQFDWSSSGLTNPLDCSQTMLLDLEQIVASLEISPCSNQIPNSQNCNNSVIDGYEWDSWLKTLPKDLETEPSAPAPSDCPAMLKPKYLDLQTADELVGSLQLIEPKSQDDFGDFETFQPAVETASGSWSPSKMMPLRETHISSAVATADRKGESLSERWLEAATVSNPGADSDDFSDFQAAKNDSREQFTEFQSVLPDKIAPASVEPLKPVILEPLKPAILQPERNFNATLPAKINWPEPGLTDDDIQNLELVLSVDKIKPVEPPPPPKPQQPKTKPVPKEDEDEWSDFVSNPQPMKSPLLPGGGAAFFERTATPDLQLSVFNLNRVKAPKQPIPVITHQGLVQTKLPFNSSAPLQPQPVNKTDFSQRNRQAPSIISNQFSRHFPQQNRVPTGNYGKQTYGLQQTVAAASNDDDDWSDFVSSPLPGTLANGFQPAAAKPNEWSRAPSMADNWTCGAPAPNIITNPGHFEVVRNGDAFQQRPTKKAAIPSISAIPDLDFIAPKSRTLTKK